MFLQIGFQSYLQAFNIRRVYFAYFPANLQGFQLYFLLAFNIRRVYFVYFRANLQDFQIYFLLAFNMRKVVLSGREKRPRDLVFLLSCKVTEEAGSGADSFVFSFLVMRRMIQSAICWMLQSARNLLLLPNI